MCRWRVDQCSVAKGPKFWPQNSKGALQKYVQPEKLAAKFSFNLPKKLKISAGTYTSSGDTVSLIFHPFAEGNTVVCKRQQYYDKILCGAEFFHQRPNFLVDLAESLARSWQHWTSGGQVTPSISRRSAPPQYCGQILVTSEKFSSNGEQPYKAIKPPIFKICSQNLLPRIRMLTGGEKQLFVFILVRYFLSSLFI
jgi:hypothetical protein